uniref:Uncharacterized protein n=1 Tax=Physcomitrium patens TaxID=3218 RepID=A0A2K1JBM7_PHYPA|nr:hypothetical protein PHYPA_019196 [Physcomitrium patens]
MRLADVICHVLKLRLQRPWCWINGSSSTVAEDSGVPSLGERRLVDNVCVVQQIGIISMGITSSTI